MTDNEMRVTIARLDGWVPDTRYKPGGDVRGIHFEKPGHQWRFFYELPDYLNSHDALAPVLAGLSEAEELAFICNLAGSDFPLWGIESARAIVRATPRKKCEDLLRVKGIFDADNN